VGSELVIVRWCDRCSGKGDDVAEHRVRVDDLDRVIDLCPGCFDEVLVAVEKALGDLADLGQPADRVTGPAMRPTPSGRAHPGKSDIDVRCKLCDYVASTPNALWQHADRLHGMKRAEYRTAATRPASALGRGAAA
jgi:hypothetical protein